MKLTSFVAWALIGSGTVLTAPDGCPPPCPSFVGQTAAGGDTVAVAASGEHVFFGMGSSVLVADFSDPSALRPVAAISMGSGVTLSDGIRAVEADGDRLYVGVGTTLLAVDVAVPESPATVASVVLDDAVLGIAAGGDYLFVASDDSGVAVVYRATPSLLMQLPSIAIPGTTFGCAVSGNALLVAASSGLVVFDVSVPAAPVETSRFDLIGHDVVVAGNRAFVAHGDGLVILDLADPLEPVELADLYLPGVALGVAVEADLACLAAEDRGLVIVDVSDPSSPVELGSLDTPGSAVGVALAGSVALVADGAGGLRVVDLSAAATPVELDAYRLPESLGGIEVAVADNTAYLGAFSTELPFETSLLLTVDVSVPEGPFVVGTVEMPDLSEALAYSAGHVYAAVGPAGVEVFDVAHPNAPTLVGSWASPDDAADLVLVGSRLFVAASSAGLEVLDVTTPASPEAIGSFATDGRAVAVDVVGDLAYVAVNGVGIQVIDAADPSAMQILGTVDPGAGTEYVALRVSNGIAVVCAGPGLLTVDVSDPANPALLSTTPDVFCFNLAVRGSYAYLTTLDDVKVVDLSDPASPVVIGESSPWGGNALGVTVSGNLLYVGAEGGLAVAGLELCAGHEPALSILSPEAGATVIQHATVTIGVANLALDCDRMGGVNTAGSGHWQLLVDGALDHDACTTSTTLSGEYAAGPHTLTARLVGNDGTPFEPAIEDTVEVVIAEHRWAVGAAARIPGAYDTSWVSDLVLHNPGADEAEVWLRFLERSQDNTDAVPVVLAVAAGSTLKLDDVVAATFGLDQASGAILVDSDRPLLVASRSFNDAEAGSYGQLVPGVPRASWSGAGDEVVLPLLQGNASYRTNLGFVNLRSQALELSFELVDAGGEVVDTQTVALLPWSFEQLTDVLPATAGVDDAYAVVSTTSSSATYLAWASVVDNRSGDPIFVSCGTAAADVLYVPAAAHVEGVAGTLWRTDLGLVNRGSTQAEYRLELLVPEGGSAPEPVSFTLDPGCSVRYGDVLGGVFEASGNAALRITVDAGELMASSRSYNDLGTSTYGQLIAGCAGAAAGGRDEELRLVHLAHSAAADAGFRTNIGFANAAAVTTSIRVDLHDGDGGFVGRRVIQLAPLAHYQLNNVFDRFTASDVDDGFAVITSPTEGASYFAYASVVDNRSGDPIYIPALPTPEP